MLMVKPALPYLDVIRAVRERFDCPVAAYNVSGEYAMVKAAAAAGHLDERQAALESLTAIKRAGADLVVSYWTEEPRVVALRQRSDLAQARGEADPGRRQLAGAGDAQRRPRRADLHPQRQRLDDRGRRRKPLRRLGAELGAAALRPRRRGDAGRDRRGGAARDDVRRADRGRGRAGGRDRRRRPVGRDGAPRLVRDRGGDERDPAGPRLHPPRPDHQVRRLLPRPLGRAPRERRLRPGDARHPVQPRRPDGARRRTPSSPPTTTSTRPRRRSSATARGWRRSSSSRWPGTWASSRRRPASSRRCEHSATPPARC